MKIGDRVIVSSAATADGRDHSGVIEEISRFLGRTFIDVRFDEPCEFSTGVVLSNLELVTLERPQERKPRGSGRTQKHMAFRCDYDLVEWLQTKPNKGGLINSLLRQAMEQEQQQ